MPGFFRLALIVSLIGAVLAAPVTAFDIWLHDENGALLDYGEEYSRLDGCLSQEYRLGIDAPGGVPVDAGDIITITGTGPLAAGHQVIVVSACFYSGGSLIDEVQQFSHTVVVDGSLTLTGEITSLDFGDCVPCLSADSMKVIVATSIGGIPPLFIWSSNNFLDVAYSGVIPTPTPVIPSTGHAGIALVLLVLSSLLVVHCRPR
ncbi:hypothetical protein JW905_05715 [bacterium]|nr:hypothetical protein [candidate division CSSED10-310 bacterium]